MWTVTGGILQHTGLYACTPGQRWDAVCIHALWCQEEMKGHTDMRWQHRKDLSDTQMQMQIHKTPRKALAGATVDAPSWEKRLPVKPPAVDSVL